MLWTTLTKPCLYQVADGTILRLRLQVSDLVIILAGTVSVLAVECYQERGGQVRKALERRGFGIQWLCILLPLVILLLFEFCGVGTSPRNSFISNFERREFHVIQTPRVI